MLLDHNPPPTKDTDAGNNDVIMEATSSSSSSRSASSSSGVAEPRWSASGVIKPIPERPEPLYPSALRPNAMGLKVPTSTESTLRLNPLSAMMGLPSLTQGSASSSMYPYLQLPLSGNAAPKYLPFGPFLYHSKYPLGKKTFHCPQCRYVTDRKNNLKRHVATMHQDCGKPLECCEVHFKSKAALRDHVMMFHRAGYKCRFCGRNFCRKALLKRHLAVHNGQKDFICSICDYATSHKSNLERHKKVHGQGLSSDEEDNLDQSMDGNQGTENHPEMERGLGHHHHYLNRLGVPTNHHHHHHHPLHNVMLRSHPYHHHSHFLDLAAAVAGQNGAMHPGGKNLVDGQIGSEGNVTFKPQDLSPITTSRESESPDVVTLSPRSDEPPRKHHSRRANSRSLSPRERPSTPPEVSSKTHGTMEEKPSDANALYRLGPKRLLFGSPYRCSDCTLSFPSQAQLSLHSRECRSEPVTSLPLPLSWPPYPLMLPSGPLSGLPFVPPLSLSGLGVPSLNPYKTVGTPNTETTGPLKHPTAGFWPFALQAAAAAAAVAPSRPEVTMMTSRIEPKEDINLPPKKRALNGSELGAIDFRTRTIPPAPSQ